MSLSKSKCWYSNNYLHFMKCDVSLVDKFNSKVCRPNVCRSNVFRPNDVAPKKELPYFQHYLSFFRLSIPRNPLPLPSKYLRCLSWTINFGDEWYKLISKCFKIVWICLRLKNGQKVGTFCLNIAHRFSKTQTKQANLKNVHWFSWFKKIPRSTNWRGALRYSWPPQ